MSIEVECVSSTTALTPIAAIFPSRLAIQPPDQVLSFPSDSGVAFETHPSLHGGFKPPGSLQSMPVGSGERNSAASAASLHRINTTEPLIRSSGLRVSPSNIADTPTTIVAEPADKEDGELEDAELVSPWMASDEYGLISSLPNGDVGKSAIPRDIGSYRQAMTLLLQKNVSRRLAPGESLDAEKTEKITEVLTDERVRDFMRQAQLVRDQMAEREMLHQPSPASTSPLPPTELRLEKRTREPETTWNDEHLRYKRGRFETDAFDAVSSSGTAGSRRDSEATLVESLTTASQRETPPRVVKPVTKATEADTFLASLAESLHRRDPRAQSPQTTDRPGSSTRRPSRSDIDVFGKRSDGVRSQHVEDAADRDVRLPTHVGQSTSRFSTISAKQRVRSPSPRTTAGRHHPSTAYHGHNTETTSAATSDAGVAGPSASKADALRVGGHRASIPPSPNMGHPIYTRGPAEAVVSHVPPVVPPPPPPPFIAKVPGLWWIKIGERVADTMDMTFQVDPETAAAIARWATHEDHFDDAARQVAVHLLCLSVHEVTALNTQVALGTVPATPEALANALWQIQTKWPLNGFLIVHLNSERPSARVWHGLDLKLGRPLDISPAILAGVNDLRLTQLMGMEDRVFVLHAGPPPEEELLEARSRQGTRAAWDSFMSGGPLGSGRGPFAFPSVRRDSSHTQL